MNHENDYFDWLCNRIIDPSAEAYLSYTRLLGYLHHRDYVYAIPLDRNRYIDGTDLRYQFGCDNHVPNSIIADILDTRPCSILEMMVALAIRCEREVMADPEKGDRTSLWFWAMIGNMGLSDMYDGKFDKAIVETVVTRMLTHDYDIYGNGGLFAVKECRYDMRTIDVYHQAMLYLAEVLRK